MTEQDPIQPQDKPGRTPSPRLRLTNWQIILIALLVVGGRLVIDFSQRIVEGQQKVNEQRQLEAEIALLEQEHNRLEAEKAYYGSPAFIESWAHNEGKMVREGETLVIPLYDSPEPLAAQTPQVSEEQPVPPWRVWWSLFFEEDPSFVSSN